MTPLLKLYWEMRQMPQKDRVLIAERFATKPDELARLFLGSVDAFSVYRNDEPFHGGHTPLEALNADESMIRGREVARALAGSPREGAFTAVAGMDLELRVVDYELEPTRTTGRAKFADDRNATRGMTLDLLMCDRDGVPAVCEVKTPGDMDPFFALVQALACAAHLATPAQMSRLGAHVDGLDLSSGRLDVFVIQLRPSEARSARFQGRFRRAAIEIADGLSRDPTLAARIRHIALLDAVDGPAGLGLAKASSEHERSGSGS